MIKQVANYFYTLLNLKKYRNNKIIIVTDEKEKELPASCPMLRTNIVWKGSNNTLIIKKPTSYSCLDISFCGDNNVLSFGKNLRGEIHCTVAGNNNSVSFGNRVECAKMNILLHDDEKITIGDNCMLANNLIIFTDGHSIYDATTKECLNAPPHSIEIGNHVWVGQNVTILKNVKIPNNSVIGANSTVTKIFDKENCVIAGNPAQIVKENINWNGIKPVIFNVENINPNF